MKPKIIVIHFGEIWLKGGNRRMFVQRLYNNIENALKDESYDKLENDRDRLLLYLNKRSDYKDIAGRLEKVFGISWFGGCTTVRSTRKEILDAVLKVSKGRTVRIEAHRSDKSLPFKSYELVSDLIRLSKKRVISLDVKSDDTVYVNAKTRQTYVSFDKHRGAQGLPVGVSGKAVILLSGGIDSPVASYYAMKRGLEPIYLHIHGFPSPDKKKLAKIYKVSESLRGYSPSSMLYFAPFHIFQGNALDIPRRYELVLFKRFLYLLAEEVSHKERADCIITGESLGQVASQTMQNLKASSAGVDQIILRPLIGMDKQEIVDMAGRIGTYRASISDYKDVCSIAIRGSELRAKAKDLDAICKGMGMKKVVMDTLKKSKREVL
ncbi:MAG: tRNA 4-thiouridine(8) synthase ThiI [Candidatus Micrarchaeota archaeon]|nr:tRNA 4-thiouridine(8) synthase ThiI [Candidatus Micrarchaeota archaeon]